jgi:hypothetical protein
MAHPIVSGSLLSRRWYALAWRQSMETERPAAGHAAEKPAEDRRLGDVDEEALEALRFGWGDAYLIGHDDERGYWAARRDRIGGLLTAANPEELRQAITEDYAVKPVPREPAERGGRDGGKAVLGADPGALLTRSPEP